MQNQPDTAVSDHSLGAMTAFSGLWVAGVHHFPVRVYYEDTDAAGVVYHANYLKFAERARTELLRSIGFDHISIRKDLGCVFVARHCEIDFRAPARLEQLLNVKTSYVAHTRTSITMVQSICNEDKILVQVNIRIVCVSENLRPQAWPESLMKNFQEYFDVN